MSFYTRTSKTIAGICLFVYFTIIFKEKPKRYDGEVEEELLTKTCKRRTEARNRSAEGVHYPNQTFYDLILSKDPEEWILQRPKIPEETKIICLCLTSNIDYKERVEIRRSWASRDDPVIKNGTVTPIFLVGNDENDLGCLVREQQKYMDLLIVKAKDTYRGLVYKLLMAFRVISKAYPEAHVIKVDRDVIFNVNKVLELLSTQTSPNIIFGHVYTDIKVVRDENSLFFVPKTFYEPEKHPWYVNGCFYIITAQSLSAIVGAAKEAKVIEIEDIFFTGILRYRARLTVTCLPNFYIYKQRTKGCSSATDRKTIGFWAGENIEQMWKDWIQFLNKPCNFTALLEKNRRF